MNYDHIRDEFIKEAEQFITEKKKSLPKIPGITKVRAMAIHLETFDDFAKELNVKINNILEKHNIEFSSEEESDEFTKYIRPTFEVLHRKYITFD